MERNARMFEDKQRLRDEHDAIFEERLEVEPTNARDIVSGDLLFRRNPAGGTQTHPAKARCAGCTDCSGGCILVAD